MKISAKGFVQIRSGKNFIADIKKLCHLGPFVVFSVIFRYGMYILFLGAPTA